MEDSLRPNSIYCMSWNLFASPLTRKGNFWNPNSREGELLPSDWSMGGLIADPCWQLVRVSSGEILTPWRHRYQSAGVWENTYCSALEMWFYIHPQHVCDYTQAHDRPRPLTAFTWTLVSWLWVLSWFWSYSEDRVYMQTEKPGYSYPSIYGKYWYPVNI